MKKKVLTILVLIYMFSAMPLMAGDFDGSKPLVCAVIETYECLNGEGCREGEAGDIDVPQFIKIDFQEKKISGALESGDMRTSGFDDLERIAGNLILQDAERGLGWSMAISEKNGKMTLSATGDQVVFVVFGACMALD